MANRCVVCGEEQTRTLALCPSCNRPRHSRCAGRKAGSECNLCRQNDNDVTRQSTPTLARMTQVVTPTTKAPPLKLTAEKTPLTTSRTTKTSKTTTVTKALQKDPQVSARALSTVPQRRPAATNTSAIPHCGSPSLSTLADRQALPIDSAPNTSIGASTKRVARVADVQGFCAAADVRMTTRDQDPPTPKQDQMRESAPSQVVPAPLGDNNLLGIANIMIPVSTLELFFNRFDMLEKKLDDLSSPENRSLACRNISPSFAEGEAKYKEKIEALVTRVSVLEGLVSNQAELLENLNKKCEMLLEQNINNKKSLDNAICGFENLQCAYKGIASDSSRLVSTDSSLSSASNIELQIRPCSRPSPDALHVGDRTDGHESCKVIITGIIKKDCDTELNILKNVAYAALKTVLPSIAREDVITARVLPARDSSRSKGGEAEGNLGSRPGALPSCIVELNSARLVAELMRAKRSLANNYLSTSVINRDYLSTESAACMPSNRKIFINEMLPQRKFEAFKDLRAVAQGLGFRYVWHSGGRFLVRRRGGERAHAFATAADLQAIQTASQDAPKRRSTVTNSTDVTQTPRRDCDETQGAAMTAGSAQAQ